MTQSAKRPVQWAAVVSPVREVSILGTADLAFWQDQLSGAGLVPADSDGRARLIVTAVDSKFKGIRFRELVIAVVTTGAGDSAQQQGYYLLHAFNTVRFFAWVERAIFSTPYYYGTIEMSVPLPASFRVNAGGSTLFDVRMPATATVTQRPPSRSGEEEWFGPVYLPGRRNTPGRSDRLFYAHLAGYLRVYPYLAEDELSITPTPAAPALQWLIDSRFTPTEWLIREDATHAKSKTYRREALPET